MVLIKKKDLKNKSSRTTQWGPRMGDSRDKQTHSRTLHLAASLTLCLSFARFRPEYAHTEHAQPSSHLPTNPVRLSEWKGLIHLLIVHHRGDRGLGPFPTPNSPHAPTHPAGLQGPEGTGQHREAARPVHGAHLLLPAHQPAVPLCPGVSPLVQPGVGPAPLEDYPPNG